MKKSLPLSREQMGFVRSLGVEDKEYTRDEFFQIAEGLVYDCLMEKGWKPGPDFEETNGIGDMCEDIITALTMAEWDES